jgi:acyl phosphate:glycerol-3-phosphate acyltransferase
MVARSKGVDITAVGSKNPGASNIARTLGTWWGVLVFVLDGLKGAIPATVGLLLDSRPSSYAWVAASVVGHMFPITRRFKGGKGVATLGGATLVLHLIVSLVLLVIWLVVRRLTGKASLASLIIAVGLPIGVGLSGLSWVGVPAWEIAAIIGLAALVFVRHADNIKRLIGGRELNANR